MEENEILDYYNENWNDYNKIVDLLHSIIDTHADEIKVMEKKLAQKNVTQESESKVEVLKKQLQTCQDILDEERHKLKS